MNPSDVVARTAALAARAPRWVWPAATVALLVVLDFAFGVSAPVPNRVLSTLGTAFSLALPLATQRVWVNRLTLQTARTILLLVMATFGGFVAFMTASLWLTHPFDGYRNRVVGGFVMTDDTAAVLRESVPQPTVAELYRDAAHESEAIWTAASIAAASSLLCALWWLTTLLTGVTLTVVALARIEFILPIPGVPPMALPPSGTPVPDIDGPARKELRLALLEAFPQPSELAMLVEEVLNERLVNVSLANDMPTRAFDLIGWAKARGRLTELVAGAAAERPKSARLQEFAGRLAFPTKADGQEERIVRDDIPFQNPAEWAARFARCRTTVARIEPQPQAKSKEGFGTGFLVGPDLLLTNYHVIDPPAPGVFNPAEVVVRFDCEFGSDGRETLGRVCKLAADWKVASSVRVAAGGLDFALIRLAEKAATDDTPTGKRGWLGLKPQTFKPGQPLFIMQHPDARPMQLAIGTVTNPTPSPVQVAYDVSTLGGSSGSPCLNSALELVAIHHWGTADQNRGVTAAALLADPALKALAPFAG